MATTNVVHLKSAQKPATRRSTRMSRAVRRQAGTAVEIATVAERVRKQIGKYARPAIIGTLIGSAGMNAFAFASQTVNPWMMAAAVTLGVAIPSLIYALTRVGAALYIDCHSRG